ncbi:TnsA endonuclease N-terminal domain-containing protein [Pseudoalteromonas piscicida]|uniref:TnsA endonuclease N-terminal domain-containing protein n=1 Tax=Pseudoalteromonas piscicida TaxID=43662 RepID=UPI0027E3EC8E|nr:TnsA endonuclease N-terminal domain-containing protein [Pseudoalteromonas piscicida]WMO15286.1 TnsA endonuclease N-terminal domain-containing protein [Pseudoalteromonas piscicida]
MAKNQETSPISGTIKRAKTRKRGASPYKIHRRVREPVSPSKGRVVGYYASHKNQRPIGWESQLELKACMLMEFSHQVKSYHEQPATLYFPCKGRVCKYTPDFEIRTKSGSTFFVEVKPLVRVNDPRIKELLCAASDFLGERGFGYVVLTEEELIKPELLRNLTMLKPYLLHRLNGDEIKILKRSLKKNDAASLETLSKVSGSLKNVYSFIAHGHASAPLAKPLDLDTEISLTSESNRENFLFNGRVAPDFEQCELSY